LRAKIVSDQHLEFRVSGNSGQKYFNAIHPRDGEKADVCIIAGDFAVMAKRVRWLFQELCERETQVLFVPGNHEYYRCASMAVVDNAFREIEQQWPNFKLLRTGEVLEFCGRRFLGDTMWVPRTADMILSAGMMNDSDCIPGLMGEIGERHQRFMSWLSDELRPGDIVVTHHLPSEHSTPSEYRDSSVKSWYVAAGVEALLAREPHAWIHGHAHSRSDYVLNETRIICNPVGYPTEIGRLPGRLSPFIFEL
jgi:Icc-related predicted phosphoesterase